MKTNHRIADLCAAMALMTFFAVAPCVFGGHPSWPPRKHSAQYRQANMLFLRFQDALAGEQWQMALSLCSDRVRAKAREWPSPEAFFKETLPVELLLAQDFGYWTLRANHYGGFDWTDRANWYGLFVNLTKPEATPVVQWIWAIKEDAGSGKWLVDYPPVRLEEYIAGRSQAIRERDDELARIRESVKLQAEGLRTRLTAISQQFVIGSPMWFRLELINEGSVPVHYQNSGIAFYGLTVCDNQQQQLASTNGAAQIVVGTRKVDPGASVVLADKIDLNSNHLLTKSGRYSVQFNGEHLEIGKPVPWERQKISSDPFGENVWLGVGSFVAITNRFPSNVIQIDVATRKSQ